MNKVLVVTGTRADFGKLKPLIRVMHEDPSLELELFVTGMHMLTTYGYTCAEVEASGYGQIYKFINQNRSDSMDLVLSKTITGFSDYVKESKPSLILIHGDRVEALACAIVGSLNNVLVGHIEGGEVSGTIDELIRHAVTKLSHVHFVANQNAAHRLAQLGEAEENVFVIGSPDIDIMNSDLLPDLQEVKRHYEIEFSDYGILLYHPVTTSSLATLETEVESLVDNILAMRKNFVVIYPNNDRGTELILKAYGKFHNNERVRVIPSMRFEYFLSLLKHAMFILGNSSAGIREAPHYGVPAINIGSRQYSRASSPMILNLEGTAEVSDAVSRALAMEKIEDSQFGDGRSAEFFSKIISTNTFWSKSKQKHFIDVKFQP